VKKLFYVFVILFLVTGCVKDVKFTDITVQEIETKINNQEDFILFIGSSSCGVCEKLTPTLKKVVKEQNKEVYYIDGSLLDDDEINVIKDILFFDMTVPKVYFIKDGSYNPYDVIITNESYETVSSKFERSNYE
jgi:predicted bacteriocin transport accessory protein